MVATQRESFVFRIDPKLLQHRPPRLTLAATLEALGQRVQSHDLDANVVVDILDEKQLLPYIIGNAKNLHVASLDQITNASKIGDIIVSEESVKGSYELCLAFLRFVQTIIKSDSYLDRSNSMLASITYIANEIYSNHHIWTYKNSADMHEILGICTDIFHHIIVAKSLSASSKKALKKSDDSSNVTKEQPSELEIVCIINLSQNQAHKQLLSVIVGGSKQIKSVLSESDFEGEQSLKTKPAVQRIRQSLEIFGKLLIRSEYIKNYYESRNIVTEQNLDGANTNYSSVPMTNIERALFDTSMRPGLLQHLFSYIYQVEDFATACLVINLIKKIAEKFSMSLMASLDSEADRVCSFFIDCLGGKNSNTEMKIAIIDLLTTCVRHQPGLIESFLNYKQEISKQDSSDKSGNQNSLKVLMDLIRECLSQQNDVHRSLHAYVMKFFLTFWQKCHSAIEQFDKVDEFWDLVARPLIKFLDSTGSIPSKDAYTHGQTLDDELVTYVLMIFAREIFNINASSSNERKLNPKLKDMMDDFASKNLVAKYSTFIVRRFKNISANMDKGDEYTRVLAGWRDFLASHTKYKPFDINQTVKNQLIEDILTCLAIELKLSERLERERLAIIGDMLLLTWMNWREDINASNVIFVSVHELLYLVDANKEYAPFSFLLTFQAFLNLYLMRARDHLLNSPNSFDLLAPALELMHFSVKIMKAFINNRPGKKPTSPSSSSSSPSASMADLGLENKPSVESRLCQASITSLRFIIDISKPHIDLWIAYFQRKLKTDSLIQFANILVDRQADPDVSVALVELLSCVTLLNQTTYYLNKSRLLALLDRVLAKKDDQPARWSADAVKLMQMIKKIISVAPSHRGSKNQSEIDVGTRY